MESYLAAARKISRSAVGDRSEAPVAANYELPRFLMQNDRMSEDLPLGTRGGMAVRHNFPLDGEYTLRIRLQKNGYTYTLGTAHARQLDVRLDGQKIKQFIVGGDYKGKRPLQPSSFGQGEYERYLINADGNLELRFPVKAGAHLVQVTFPNQTAEDEGIFQPPITDFSYALSYGRSIWNRPSRGLPSTGPTTPRAFRKRRAGRRFHLQALVVRSAKIHAQSNSLHARAPCVSPAGDRRRRRRLARFLSHGARARRVRGRH
jgi:hypothetical protein